MGFDTADHYRNWPQPLDTIPSDIGWGLLERKVAMARGSSQNQPSTVGSTKQCNLGSLSFSLLAIVGCLVTSLMVGHLVHTLMTRHVATAGSLLKITLSDILSTLTQDGFAVWAGLQPKHRLLSKMPY
jgi:hypothetical protein